VQFLHVEPFLLDFLLLVGRHEFVAFLLDVDVGHVLFEQELEKVGEQAELLDVVELDEVEQLLLGQDPLDVLQLDFVLHARDQLGVDDVAHVRGGDDAVLLLEHGLHVELERGVRDEEGETVGQPAVLAVQALLGLPLVPDRDVEQDLPVELEQTHVVGLQRHVRGPVQEFLVHRGLRLLLVLRLLHFAVDLLLHLVLQHFQLDFLLDGVHRVLLLFDAVLAPLLARQ